MFASTARSISLRLFYPDIGFAYLCLWELSLETSDNIPTVFDATEDTSLSFVLQASAQHLFSIQIQLL
jgi:hypothetical protein